MTDFGEAVTAHVRSWPKVQKVPAPKLELFTVRDFVPEAMRANLIALIDTKRRPSTIADPNGDDYFRTSETCDLPPDDPQVQALRDLFTRISGIDIAYAEPSQGQRYDVGQEFKNHTDYFEPTGADFQKYCSVAGQRTWTFMVYLNEPEAGGATRFKVAGKTFQPEAGRLVCWNNMRADGTPNPATLHHGMKVRKGVKYVITQWYRERPWK
ncbi:prolyl hydroxylase family protein [Croceicoccus naphthovorans]|uniref:Oxygenase n=1 Tax=Croceicoccus naphthovorans TaxID=1348774 RepID=A0A0G3XJ10_9SPHN|nr:2OG-Fe(II) oxygenase [Croceicoccus naphthovorans]AKM10589.1 oxygenase [Croceicoccus naphthovorans]MBB3988807.1 prolyl 4-hydroxylase [Croceicoccus naphthovorans]